MNSATARGSRSVRITVIYAAVLMVVISAGPACPHAPGRPRSTGAAATQSGKSPRPARMARRTGEPAVPKTPKRVCGELMAVAYEGPGGREVRGARGEPETGEPGVPESALGRLLYVDLLLIQGGPRLERYLVAPNVRLRISRVDDSFQVVSELTRDPLELELAGFSFRPQSVRLTLDSQGRVEQIESLEWVWCGVLTRVEGSAVWLRGWPSDARSSVEDELLSLGGDYKGPDARQIRIPLHPTAQVCVNLDRVPRQRLAAERGQVVEIVPDCEGRARYVDVLKINSFYNFTGGGNAFYLEEDADGRRTRLKRDPQGRWGFIERPPVRNGEAPRKVRWAALDVKVYDMRRLRKPIEEWEGKAVAAVAGVWFDPKTGLVTHVFWGGTTE